MYKIYKYTNTVNGKIYIGQTKRSLEERAQSNGNNYKECRRFYNAIKKYSWSAFAPEILAEVDSVDEANRLEEYYIQLYKSTDPEIGYNLSSGGLNKEMPDESKKVISEKAKERYKDKTANPMYGKKHSEAAKKKQSVAHSGESNPMYGSKWNETQRMRSGTKGKKLNLSDEQRRALSDHMKTVIETSVVKEVICVEDNIIYRSVTDAAKTYGASVSTLCGHLKGYQNTCKGKHFQYVISEGATTIET